MKDELNKKVDSLIKDTRNDTKKSLERRITKEEQACRDKQKNRVVLFPWLKGAQREAAIERMFKKYGI